MKQSEEGQGEMNQYRIMNRITRQWWDGEAESAHEAYQKAGWPVADCWVRQYVPPHRDPRKDSGMHYGGWKKPDDAPELGKRGGAA